MGEQIENVPHDEWLRMLQRSQSLLNMADAAKRAGDTAYARQIWATLRPLNCQIREIARLPSTRETWPTRSLRITPHSTGGR